jgi:starvation-inducible DNA-binding protein
MDKLVAAMKVLLGTAFSLYLKAHGFHWNVEGPLFPELHKLFEKIYEDAWESVDDIAEQIRQLDTPSPSSMDSFQQLSLVETTDEVPSPADMVVALFKDTETIISALTSTLQLAVGQNKQGLVNFLALRIETHSKQRWMLRATARVPSAINGGFGSA